MKKITLLLSISFIFYACPQSVISDNCSREYFSFDIPVSFEPMDSIVYVGDTITVTSTFSNKLKSNETGELFLFDSIDFHMDGGFIKLDTLIDFQKGYRFTDDFTFIVDTIYNLRKGNNYFAFESYYDNENYYVKLKFIPKVKGIYLFDYHSRINVFKDVKGKIIYAVDSECKTNGWYPHFKTNNGNNYKEFLKESPTEYYNTKYYKEWSRYNTIDGAHCFKVE